MQNNEKKIGVILMTYGSATTTENVGEYMQHIYHGKVADGVVADFEERYRLVGHSPLVEITEKQAEALQRSLGEKYIVRAGMLHSKPFIDEAVKDCKTAGAERCVGIILSPQFSSFIMDGYRAAFERAGESNGFIKEQMTVVGPWPTEPHFIELLADRVKKSLKELQAKYGGKIPVVFTTHSLPQRVVEKDPSYLDQLKATTDAVLEKIGDADLEWYAGYQSAGHTPEEWLKPDLTDILANLRDKRQGKSDKERSPVLIVPIQFLADHLEILYDLDIAARKQCEEFNIAYHRIELPNADTRFIEALAGIAKNY